jgi:hypothetical protein
MSELSSSVRILQYMFLSVVRDPLFISSPFASDVEAQSWSFRMSEFTANGALVLHSSNYSPSLPEYFFLSE